VGNRFPFVLRDIDTGDPAIGDEVFRGAGHIQDGEIVTYHVTDNPESLLAVLDAGDDLTAHGGVDDLGVGLYGSDNVSVWNVRSRRKWDFLNDLDAEDRSSIADDLSEEIWDMRKERHISQGEYEAAMTDLDNYIEYDMRYGVMQLSAQPYNIEFWQQDWLEKAGVYAETEQPAVVEIRARGRFGYLDRYLSEDEARNMLGAGYVGAMVPNGMGTIGQMVIWDRSSITGYEVVTSEKRWDEEKHPRWPAGNSAGGQFMPSTAAGLDPDTMFDAVADVLGLDDTGYPKESRMAQAIRREREAEEFYQNLPVTDDEIVDALGLDGIDYPINLSVARLYRADGDPRIEIPGGVDGGITIPLDRLRSVIQDVDAHLDYEEVSSVTIDAFNDRLYMEWDLHPDRWDISKKPSFQIRAVMQADGVMDFQYLALRSMGDGAGLKIADSLFGFANDIGMETVKLEADISIGRYAWARAGFDFNMKTSGNSAKMFDWLDILAGNMKRNNDPSLRLYLDERFPQGESTSPRDQFVAQYPIFTASEMADFGRGETFIPGKYIINPDVSSNVHAGKGYMLDELGLGIWWGTAKLADLVSAPVKAVSDALRGIAPNSGEASSETLPVLLICAPSEKPPGATDLPHWSQYMEMDDFPIFFDASLSAKTWDESRHPRHAAGTSEGGQFAPAGTSGGDRADVETNLDPFYFSTLSPREKFSSAASEMTRADIDKVRSTIRDGESRVTLVGSRRFWMISD